MHYIHSLSQYILVTLLQTLLGEDMELKKIFVETQRALSFFLCKMGLEVSETQGCQTIQGYAAKMRKKSHFPWPSLSSAFLK